MSTAENTHAVHRVTVQHEIAHAIDTTAPAGVNTVIASLTDSTGQLVHAAAAIQRELEHRAIEAAR